ncbi:hypothetical protein NDU88_007614 [Pleurodeles waltl]|uniref:Uncharacterized protein n=1 Tax=Pleurodeles waltl TaxID=8319 RepID=A0AAV7QQA7_PLEWA|nr:hypothetical protein NDU88_007614 [Pleurodeles waltl]
MHPKGNQGLEIRADSAASCARAHRLRPPLSRQSLLPRARPVRSVMSRGINPCRSASFTGSGGSGGKKTPSPHRRFGTLQPTCYCDTQANGFVLEVYFITALVIEAIEFFELEG